MRLSNKYYPLHFGPYRTPSFKYGQRVKDEARGEVVIVGLSNGRIPWPIGKRGSYRSLVIYKGFAKALRMESHAAVGYWWGINCVSKFRRRIGVGASTEGTRRLMAKAWRDPKRRAKIAAAKRGKPRPQHVLDAMRSANQGRTPTPESRLKMSIAQKRRGAWPPAAGRAWTKREDALLYKFTATEVAARIGRSLKAVSLRRRKLGLPDARRKS